MKEDKSVMFQVLQSISGCCRVFPSDMCQSIAFIIFPLVRGFLVGASFTSRVTGMVRRVRPVVSFPSIYAGGHHSHVGG